MIKKTGSQGFTLIELLVVIAIIGILASVVLASLNTARERGSNAAIQSNISNIRAQAEIVFDGDYDAVCGANSVTQDAQIATLIAAANTQSGGTAVCGRPASGSASAWAVSSPLRGGGNWCADSVGASRRVAAAIGANVTVCPAS